MKEIHCVEGGADEVQARGHRSVVRLANGLVPALVTIAVILPLIGGCTDPSGPPQQVGGAAQCLIDTDFVVSGGVSRDGIPALTDPPFVSPDHADAAYLEPGDRIVGLVINGEALAVPHNTLWWHEIVNLNHRGIALSVTYCPMTGSSIVFDRAGAGGAEFGVSGLLFQNNLMMYDRRDPPSLWPQMSRGARCGPEIGRPLDSFPAVDMRWDGWLELHPDTRVVSGALGFGRNYGLYPYGSYESDAPFLVDMPFHDDRLFAKERVLGLPAERGAAIAFPIVSTERWRVAEFDYAGAAAVVFWDRDKQAAVALRPVVDDMWLTFDARPEGIFDHQTQSRWSVVGAALEGPLAGEDLDIIPEAYVSFWGAWSVFEPGSRIWEN